MRLMVRNVKIAHEPIFEKEHLKLLPSSVAANLFNTATGLFDFNGFKQLPWWPKCQKYDVICQHVR